MSTVRAVATDNNFLLSKYYRATREIQNNTILNRATIELLGADIPSSLTELVGRNWKTALEVAFRISLFIVTSFFIPLLFIPSLNKFAQAKFKLPNDFNKLFYNQFEDLTPEKDTVVDDEKFVEKLISLESEEKVKKYFGDIKNISREKIIDFKQKLLKAKSNVVKLDILYAGLLTYLVPWTQVWFAKKILGVVGYTGELDLLDESQREQSASLHEKTKYFKFALGVIPTVFGSNWYSDKIYKAANSADSQIKSSKFLCFIKKHIKQFDYYKAIYANRLNLAGTLLFGGDFGFLLASRSLNELIERCLRLIVFWPTMFFGVEWLNSKLAEKCDKNNGTNLIDHSLPKELGIAKVKSLETLENELHRAEVSGDEPEKERLLNSIKTQAKIYWQSILADSLVMGVGLTAANIIGTKMRVQKGIY